MVISPLDLETKTNCDMKFGAHSPRPYLCFFETLTLRVASFKKLPCHLDFVYISLIVFFFFRKRILIFRKFKNNLLHNDITNNFSRTAFHKRNFCHSLPNYLCFFFTNPRNSRSYIVKFNFCFHIRNL